MIQWALWELSEWTIWRENEYILPRILKHYLKIRLGGKVKWYMLLFYHLLDLIIINSWILHRKICVEKNEKAMPLADFRGEIADCLCRVGNTRSQTRGRPSLSSVKIRYKKKLRTAVQMPSRDIRTDNIGHWPLYITDRNRCKHPNCKKLTYVKYEKCKDSNCFKDFHIM